MSEEMRGEDLLQLLAKECAQNVEELRRVLADKDTHFSDKLHLLEDLRINTREFHKAAEWLFREMVGQGGNDLQVQTSNQYSQSRPRFQVLQGGKT